MLKKLTCPDDDLWTIRRGAVAIITMGISHSRYLHGEAVIETKYRLYEGVEDADPPSRIWLGDSRRAVVTQLFDKLFDMVLVARGYDVVQVIIDVPGTGLGEWENDILVTTYIIAHELKLTISGLTDPETFACPGKMLTLCDGLSQTLYGEEEDRTIKHSFERKT